MYQYIDNLPLVQISHQPPSFITLGLYCTVISLTSKQTPHKLDTTSLAITAHHHYKTNYHHIYHRYITNSKANLKANFIQRICHILINFQIMVKFHSLFLLLHTCMLINTSIYPFYQEIFLLTNVTN